MHNKLRCHWNNKCCSSGKTEIKPLKNGERAKNEINFQHPFSFISVCHWYWISSIENTSIVDILNAQFKCTKPYKLTLYALNFHQKGVNQFWVLFDWKSLFLFPFQKEEFIFLFYWCFFSLFYCRIFSNVWSGHFNLTFNGANVTFVEI